MAEVAVMAVVVVILSCGRSKQRLEMQPQTKSGRTRVNKQVEMVL